MLVLLPSPPPSSPPNQNRIQHSRAMERDEEHQAERIQALKLVRQLMEIDCSLMPKNIVQALTSIAEYHEDGLARVALETLCEIGIGLVVKNFIVEINIILHLQLSVILG